MLNDTTIKGLKKAHASLLRQRAKLDEDITALERILANNNGGETTSVRRTSATVAPSATHPAAYSASLPKGEVVRRVREACHNLGRFSKNDVENYLKDKGQNFEDVQIRRAMTRLLVKNEIYVITEGSGRRPSEYGAR